MMYREDYLQLRTILGWDLLVSCSGTDWTTMRKFFQGTQDLPREVAARLDFLKELVDCLECAYNRQGIRQWFRRQRCNLLYGQAPAQILIGNWRPEDYGPQKVMSLARELTGPGNAT